MIRLTFVNSRGERKIGDYDSKDEADEAMKAFLAFRCYKPRYWRVSPVSEKSTMIDVGSYIEFFMLKEIE